MVAPPRTNVRKTKRPPAASHPTNEPARKRANANAPRGEGSHDVHPDSKQGAVGGGSPGKRFGCVIA